MKAAALLALTALLFVMAALDLVLLIVVLRALWMGLL